MLVYVLRIRLEQFIVLDNFLMGPQIILVEITKPHKVGLRYTILEAEVWPVGFKWNERSNNPEKNSAIGRYRSEPQYILWMVLST